MDEMDRIMEAVNRLLEAYQKALRSVQVVLGGSLVSKTFVPAGAKVVDVDVMFLVDDPDQPGLVGMIERGTGLRYRKSIQANNWPEGTSAAHLIEGMVAAPGVELPLEVEGCLRNRRYVIWHDHYRRVFSEAELAAYCADKARLRGEKRAYDLCKEAMLAEAKRRIVAAGLVG